MTEKSMWGTFTLKFEGQYSRNYMARKNWGIQINYFVKFVQVNVDNRTGCIYMSEKERCD